MITITMFIFIISITGSILLLSAAYFYWVYVPVAKEPMLTTTVVKKQLLTKNGERTYLSYVPKHVPGKNRPALIIVLHGSGIDGKTIRQWTGYQFDILADQHGFIVVYPDGYKGNWNEIRKQGPYAAKKENIDDTGFLKKLIAEYQQEYDADINRVYAFGYSNGGGMALRLAMEASGVLAGVVAVSVTLPVPENRIAEPVGNIPPVMFIHGSADKIVPYPGGRVTLFGRNFGYAISVQETAEIFARKNRGILVHKFKLPHREPSDSTSVEHQVWKDDERSVVELFTVNGGGHVIPQQKTRIPRIMGKVTKDLNAPVEAVRFFGFGI